MSDRRRSYRPALPTEPPPNNIQPPLPPTTPAVTRYAGRITVLEAEVERLHGVSGEYLTALEEANATAERLLLRVADLTLSFDRDREALRAALAAEKEDKSHTHVHWYYSSENIPGKFVVAIREGKKLYYDAPEPPPHMLEGAEQVNAFWSAGEENDDGNETAH